LIESRMEQEHKKIVLLSKSTQNFPVFRLG